MQLCSPDLKITDYKFTQTKQNTVSKRANANLTCTLPFRTNVSIYVTFRAGRSYGAPRARNCVECHFSAIVSGYVWKRNCRTILNVA